MDIPVSILAQGGFGLLVSIAVWFIFTGRLVPRSTLQDAQRQRDRWEATAESLAVQNRELLENFRVVNDFMRTFPRPKDGAGE
jgi:hypothetical protein